MRQLRAGLSERMKRDKSVTLVRARTELAGQIHARRHILKQQRRKRRRAAKNIVYEAPSKDRAHAHRSDRSSLTAQASLIRGGQEVSGRICCNEWAATVH